MYIFNIYMLSCPVSTPPFHGMVFPGLGLGPSIRLRKTTSHASSLYFLTKIDESPANTIG